MKDGKRTSSVNPDKTSNVRWNYFSSTKKLKNKEMPPNITSHVHKYFERLPDDDPEVEIRKLCKLCDRKISVSLNFAILSL